MSHRETHIYGKYYWCITVPDTVSSSGEIYVHADEANVDSCGALVMVGTQEHPVLALAPGAWITFFAASCIDGAAVAVEHWPNQIQEPFRSEPRRVATVRRQPRSAKAEGLDPRRSFSENQKQEIWNRSNGHCGSCGGPLADDWQADHIYPHSLGGVTEVKNGQALCQPCNGRKKAKVLVVE